MIASILKYAYDSDSIGDRAQYMLVSELAAYFMQDNPRFNEKMFYEACGLDEQGKRIKS